MPHSNILSSVWYVKENDLIGGWCIMDVDASPGEANRAEIADYLTKEAAEYIVGLHNNTLKARAHIDELSERT